jgi:diaminopimelate decarboxylase
MDTGYLSALADTYGYPFYLYDETVIAVQWKALRRALPDFSILYSLKANPCPAVCRFLRGLGAGADAASAAEVESATAAGFAPKDIFYSAPGKGKTDLRACAGKATPVADSWTELERLNALAAELGCVLPVGLRVNPDMAFGPGNRPEIMSGRPAKFGVDEEELESRRAFINALAHLRIIGVHVFLRSQILDHNALAAYCLHVFRLGRFCVADMGLPLSFLNFGGGFGIAADPTQKELDLAALRRALAGQAAEYRGILPGVRFMVESGRFLTARAGIFVSRIEDVKRSRGECFALVPGGLNGFLRPALMNLLGAHAVPGPLEPLFSSPGAHAVALPERDDAAVTRVSVVGTLCTALDVLAKDVPLPEPRPGDILTVSNAGAYAATLSPFAFAGFSRPLELYRDAQGRVSVAS